MFDNSTSIQWKRRRQISFASSDINWLSMPEVWLKNNQKLLENRVAVLGTQYSICQLLFQFFLIHFKNVVRTAELFYKLTFDLDSASEQAMTNDNFVASMQIFEVQY